MFSYREVSLPSIPEPPSKVFGRQITRFGADGVVMIQRQLPGKKNYERASFWEIYRTDTGMQWKEVFGRVIDSDVKEEVSKFWTLNGKEELHAMGGSRWEIRNYPMTIDRECHH
jgi:hypothetical protein